MGQNIIQKVEIKKKTNPYKANQWRPDPRQSLFLAYFLDPESETFSNALQSALKAKYSKEYAEVITAQMPTWLSENLGDADMLRKAEENLREFLGNASEKVKADITKFVAERLGKKKWGEKREIEHSGQIDIGNLLNELDDDTKRKTKTTIGK